MIAELRRRGGDSVLIAQPAGAVRFQSIGSSIQNARLLRMHVVPFTRDDSLAIHHISPVRSVESRTLGITSPELNSARNIAGAPAVMDVGRISQGR